MFLKRFLRNFIFKPTYPYFLPLQVLVAELPCRRGFLQNIVVGILSTRIFAEITSTNHNILHK